MLADCLLMVGELGAGAHLVLGRTSMQSLRDRVTREVQPTVSGTSSGSGNERQTVGKSVLGKHRLDLGTKRYGRFGRDGQLQVGTLLCIRDHNGADMGPWRPLKLSPCKEEQAQTLLFCVLPQRHLHLKVYCPGTRL